jgi:hypothetical protein
LSSPGPSKRESSALAVILACLLGFSCGGLASRKSKSTLPSAGDARDDGSGLLAAVSMGPTLGGDDKKDATGGNNYAYKSDYSYGGSSYGGTGYGASTYGGSIYSNYFFTADYNSLYAPLPNQYEVGYSIQTVEDGGSIEGTVTWPKPPNAADNLPNVSPTCAKAPQNNTLSVKGGKVAGAVVYLEDIRKGRAHPSDGQSRKLQIGGLIVRGDCSMFPRVQVVAPIGSTITLRSAASGKRETRLGYYKAPTLGAPEAEHSIETLSAGSERDFRVDLAGFYAAIAEGAESQAGAWVVVAGHPYYSTTDGNGRFELEDIPPGTYSMVVWHPSVYLGNGKWTEPTIARRKVSVKAFAATRASVALK